MPNQKTQFVAPALSRGLIPVLIDDWTTNIDPWNQAGGIGILHVSASSSIQKLQEVLQSNQLPQSKSKTQLQMPPQTPQQIPNPSKGTNVA
jgi:hypothetical protein